MTPGTLLADLLALGTPTAVQLLERFTPIAKNISSAGPQLSRPAWARRVNDAQDTFLDLDGDVPGLQLWEDERGWGAYAEFAVTRGTLEDVEAVVGKTSPMPRAPGAFNAGDKVSAYVGKIRVLRIGHSKAPIKPRIAGQGRRGESKTSAHPELDVT